MKQLDLFAGIGGISLAAEWAGIETVAFCEKEPFAQDILRRRFPDRPIYDDVYNLTREVLENDGITGIDIVAGGFPCQPFSHAGKRTGTDDDRYLWPEMCRIVGELRPAWVFAENVDGLVSMAQSNGDIVMEDETTICTEAEMVLETIRKDLKEIGYRSIPVIIPACGVGASHRRYRIFIVAHANSGQRERSQYQIQTGRDAVGVVRETMADTESERCGETWESSKRSEKWIASSNSLAHSTGEGLERSSRSELQRTSGGFASSSEIVANATGGRRPGSGQPFQPCDSTENREWEASQLVDVRLGEERAAQSGLGGDPYELPDWLDGWGMNPMDALINFITSYPQPALMGQEQYAWEPPRVATGVKNRASRLKALGNAVDPLQALPVLYAIRVIHEFLAKGGSLV